MSGMVRKFMPDVPLIEAVETYDLAGAVDIWVPKNVFYQENQKEFEKIRTLGDKLWFYTCCFPGRSLHESSMGYAFTENQVSALGEL